MNPIKGLTAAKFEIDPHEHGITNTITEGTHISGGKLRFPAGVQIDGIVEECEEIICHGTLIIGENAQVSSQIIKADCLINLGNTMAGHIIVPGTLVAWSGSITGGMIVYAAFEKSAGCQVKGHLDQISGENPAHPEPSRMSGQPISAADDWTLDTPTTSTTDA